MRISDWSSDVCSSDLLHLNARDVGVLVVGLGVLEDGPIALLDLAGAVEADQHAARLGLVQDVLRDDLQHHRKADPLRGGGGFLRRLDEPLLRHGYVVGIADLLAFRRAERRAPGLADLLQRSEEHTSELQSLMRISYAVFCLKKKR